MLAFTVPPKSATNHTIASNQYNDLEYLETSAQYTAVSGTASSNGTGATFDVNRVGLKYYVALNAGGTLHTRLETITIAGTSLGGATPANDLVITATTVTSGVIVDFDISGLPVGGNYIAVPNNTAGQYSTDGSTWSASTFPSSGSGNWTAVASGLQNDGSSVYKSSAAIADTKLATISTAGKVALTALEIDGGSDIGADLADADLIIVDDGAGGTNKKAAISRIKTYLSSAGFSQEDPTALAIALG